MNESYIATVRLLLQVAPVVFASRRFAMKGGTALNLFVQDMPRLSVDIDVVYLDAIASREVALQTIAQELGIVKLALEHQGLQARLPANAQGDEVRLLVTSSNAQVKVEVNFVFRGTVLPPLVKPLVATAQDLFTTAVSVPGVPTMRAQATLPSGRCLVTSASASPRLGSPDSRSGP